MAKTYLARKMLKVLLVLLMSVPSVSFAGECLVPHSPESSRHGNLKSDRHDRRCELAAGTSSRSSRSPLLIKRIEGGFLIFRLRGGLAVKGRTELMKA